MFVPARTPRPVVDRLYREVARIVAMPEVRERLAVRGSVPRGTTPEEFDKFVRSEVEKITRVIKSGNIRIE